MQLTAASSTHITFLRLFTSSISNSVPCWTVTYVVASLKRREVPVSIKLEKTYDIADPAHIAFRRYVPLRTVIYEMLEKTMYMTQRVERRYIHLTNHSGGTCILAVAFLGVQIQLFEVNRAVDPQEYHAPWRIRLTGCCTSPKIKLLALVSSNVRF